MFKNLAYRLSLRTYTLNFPKILQVRRKLKSFFWVNVLIEKLSGTGICKIFKNLTLCICKICSKFTSILDKVYSGCKRQSSWTRFLEL